MKRRLHRFCLLVSFSLPLGVYFYTTAPGVFWEDSAIFSTAAVTLGIPHSPGFPLWVLLGKLFTWLIPHNPARACNLMCGFFGAVAVALVYLCVHKVLAILNRSFSEDGIEGGELPPPPVCVTALAAALLFAFSLPVWLQAVRAEVYSLQLVLSLGALLAALTLNETEKPTRFFLLAAFLWGLSAAVHPLLSVSVLPGLLLLGSFRSQNWRGELSKWGWAFGLVFAASTLYLLLPLRSVFDPYMNWNQPDNWERFLSVVTRKDSWAFSVANTPSNFSYPQFLRLGSFLVAEYTVFFWGFAITGLLVLARALPKLGLGIFVLLLSNLGVVLWAAGFSPWNLDLQGYLTFGMALGALAAAAGFFITLVCLSGRLHRPLPLLHWGVPVLTGALALFMGLKNRARADLHHSFWPQTMAREILQSLPSGAVLFCATDKILTPLWYTQGALDVRPDVTILLNDIFVRPLLAEQSKRRNPDLPIDPKRMYPFTRSGLQQGFKNFIETCGRPVYTQVGEHITDWNKFAPAGYVLRYQKRPVGPTVTADVFNFVNQAFAGEPDFSSREVFGIEVFNWGVYLSRLGAADGESLAVKAGWLDPKNPRVWTDLAKAYMFSKRFDLAENCFRLALFFDPYQGDNYLFLAFVLRQQGKDQEADAVLAEGNLLVPDRIVLRGWRNDASGN